MAHLEAAYRKLPVGAQHAAVTAYGLYWRWLRFGPGYSSYVKDYERREQFGIEEWQVWQRKQLHALLDVAATKIPFYMEVWTKRERDSALAGRIEDLPLLEKDSVRANPEAFLRRDMRPRNRLVFHTSGTTGTPIRTIWTVQELRHSMALRETRSARWAGVSFRFPRATFSGRMVEPNPESKGPYYRFNVAERQAYLSPFHLRPDTAWVYVEALRKHKVAWLTGYAVSYYLLAKFMLEQGLRVSNLKAVITTSEKLTPEMRATMQTAYGCPAYEEYSTVENACFASECQQGRLHLSPDAGYVEILREDGSTCEPGEIGEVVATPLMRRYQSFIRYRLGDLAIWDGEACPCGRAMPVIKEIVGRIEDIVIGVDGRQMVRFHGIFVDQPHVQEGQVVQEALNRIRVKVVATEDFGPSDTAEIVRRVQQRLGSQTEVIVDAVKQIPRSPAGKFKAVVSLIGKGKAPQ
jgi:phenylacetate-CoA ligase